MIGVGIRIIALGLMFFMAGLRLGLRPLGETIGAILPRNSSVATEPIVRLYAGAWCDVCRTVDRVTHRRCNVGRLFR